jgi:DNA-binding XRE family transcriptional regulator
MTPARAVARPASGAGRFHSRANVASSGNGVSMTAKPAPTHADRSWTTVLDGTRLRRLRREHGLSQEQLANRAAISLTTVARLERQSRASCRGRTLARLAAALDEQPGAISPGSPADRTQPPSPP